MIEGKEDKLKELRKEKRKILDQVKDTETYKVAKELLEKYDPTSLAGSPNQTRTPISTNPNLRYRGAQSNPGSPMHHLQSPLRQGMNTSMQAPGVQRAYPAIQGPGATPMQTPMRQGSGPVMIPQMMNRQMTAPRMTRPVPPSDRSVVEKLVDYVVGDGPSNRYALICANCKSHNGMALKDEFEYISFYCAYCRFPNQARKQRPFAPKLPQNVRSPQVVEPDSDSDRASDKTGIEITDVSSPNRTVLASPSEAAGLDVEDKREENNDECKEEDEDASAAASTKDSSLLSETDDAISDVAGDRVEENSIKRVTAMHYDTSGAE